MANYNFVLQHYNIYKKGLVYKEKIIFPEEI